MTEEDQTGQERRESDESRKRWIYVMVEPKGREVES